MIDHRISIKIFFIIENHRMNEIMKELKNLFYEIQESDLNQDEYKMILERINIIKDNLEKVQIYS